MVELLRGWLSFVVEAVESSRPVDSVEVLLFSVGGVLVLGFFSLLVLVAGGRADCRV